MRLPTSLVVLAAISSVSATPRNVTYDPLKQLALDTRTLERAENAHLVLGTPAKDARTPLFRAAGAGENSANNLYPSVRWDEREQLLKLWHKILLADAVAIAQLAAHS